MSKENDYTFGQMEVYCDTPNCNARETIEGFDNYPPSYADANTELRSMGWKSVRVGAEWKDLCPEHSSIV